jgi:hypothetical protein
MATDINEAELARTYRKHASALRAVACFDEDSRVVQLLKHIAADYDQAADNLEALVSTNEAYAARHNA